MRFLKLFSVLFFYLFVPSFLNAQFGKNKVQFKEYNWYFFETEHFKIYFEKGSDFLAKYSALESEKYYQLFKVWLNYELEEKVPIIIYNSPNDFWQTNITDGILPEGVQGFTEAFKSRVVLPFNGNYNEYRHTLHHELTHAIFHYFLYGGKVQNLLNKRRLIQLPLWFEEGLPEFATTFWDTEADMIMRDAQIYGYLPPLEYLNGYFAYKGGQSVYYFIYETYGEEKIGELLRNSKRASKLENLFKETFGLKIEEFNEKWSKWVKKRYWREIEYRQEAKEIAIPVTKHIKDKSYFNLMPAISPNGEYVAYFSDKSDYVGIFIKSLINKKDIRCILKSGEKGGLESFHFYNSKINWSYDGNKLTFVSKSKNKDFIAIFDVQKKKIIRKLELDFDGIYSPSFIPGDSGILFSGFKSGVQNAFIYYLKSDKLVQLTNDEFSCIDPVISPNGKLLAFVSNRPKGLNSEKYDKFKVNLGYNDQNIVIYDIKQKVYINVTNNSFQTESPEWSYDGKYLAYVSDENGIFNIYIYDVAKKTNYPITNLLSGAKQISWAKKSQKLVFSSFYKGGWDIFLLNNPLKNIGKYDKLKPTLFLQSNEKEKYMSRFLKLQWGETINLKKRHVKVSNKVIFKYKNKEYLLFTEKKDNTTLLRKKLDINSSKDTTLKIKDLIGDKYVKYIDEKVQNSLPYLTSFSPDIMTGNFYYDTYYGMAGQAVFSFSDVMNNHRIIIFSDLYYSFENSNFQVMYYFLPKRWDLGLSFFHYKYDYQLTYYDILSIKQTGGFAILSYPFNIFRRLEFIFNSYALYARQYVYDWYYDMIFLQEQQDMRVNLLQSRYVFDNILYNNSGPSNGTRYYISYEKSFAFNNSDVSFNRVSFDYRKYFNFRREYIFALRLFGGKSFGRDPQDFFLGGVENWLNYSRQYYDSWDMRSTYFADLVLPMRGYRLYSQRGKNAFLMNLEFRFNLIDYLIFHFPLKIGFFSIGGVLFTDFGAAWNDNFKFWENDHLATPIASYGYGFRINIGFTQFKIDVAWPTDFSKFKTKPNILYSFGIDF